MPEITVQCGRHKKTAGMPGGRGGDADHVLRIAGISNYLLLLPLPWLFLPPFLPASDAR
jgi:hypothetical protein